MKKFVLNKDNKPLKPTEEQLNRQKDFARLHHKYETLTKRNKKKIYQDKKFFFLLFLIGLVALLLFLEK